MTAQTIDSMPAVRAHDIDFFVIGGQRCGTTWLYRALSEHPETFLPANKQTYYFDSEYAKGPDWYLSHFDGAQPGKELVGEVATGYCMPQAVPRLASDCPQAKLIMIVRNPIERAFSYYKNRKPFNDWASFEDALEKNDSIYRRGQYIDQIEDVLRQFPEDQFLLLFYDDLESDESGVFRQVCHFLGIDVDFTPKVIGNPVHANTFPRLREVAYRYKFAPILSWLNRGLVGNLARRILRARPQEKRTAAMNNDTRQQLRAHFEPFNQRLADWARRDLSHWR